MSLRRATLIVVAALALSTRAGVAGPCSLAIAQARLDLDSYLEARAAAGSYATEVPSALMHRQPTPDSIATAEAALGELDRSSLDVLVHGLPRARALDRVGDISGCEQAVHDVELAISPIRHCGRSACR